MEKTASRLVLAIAAAAALGSTPVSASAQTSTHGALSSASLAKSEAILGGSRSALAEILAQQQGVALPAPLRPAAMRTRTPFTTAARVQNLISPGVLSGRPDVFGSVALDVERTPLDRRWRKVVNRRVGGSEAAYARSLRRLGEVERIEAINAFVNSRVRFVDDSRQYGRPDQWTAAADTLRRGKGDCEDYAIAKLQMLRSAGFSDRDLYLVVLKDLARRSDHAVLVVRTADRMLMLDNGTDVVADTETVADYRPVLTFAANGVWTHGYRRSVASLQYAQAEMKPLAPAAD